MKAEMVANKALGRRKAGRARMARCLAHEDREPSLSITETLMVDEGIESSFAAMQATGFAARVALSTAGPRALELPPMRASRPNEEAAELQRGPR